MGSTERPAARPSLTTAPSGRTRAPIPTTGRGSSSSRRGVRHHRDYLADPERGRRATWHIEAVDPPATRRDTDADLARRFGAAVTWLRDQASIVPIALGEPNTVDEPYGVPRRPSDGRPATRRTPWALRPGGGRGARHRGPLSGVCVLERLPVEPVPAHLRLRLRARDPERIARSVYEDDGSWRLVVAGRDPGHPNWISTAGHDGAAIWFRWFLPEVTPSAAHHRRGGPGRRRGRPPPESRALASSRLFPARCASRPGPEPGDLPGNGAVRPLCQGPPACFPRWHR